LASGALAPVAPPLKRTPVYNPLKIYKITSFALLSFKCNVPRQRHTPYKSLLDTLNMNSLATRRNIIDLKFLYKVVNGIINSIELLNYLNFYVPQCQTRSTNTFSSQLDRTNYLINVPINIMRYASRFI